MQDTFITKIHINKVRHLENVDIELSEHERRHLIITGKNGSGKTSLLEAIRASVVMRQLETLGNQEECRVQHELVRARSIVYNGGTTAIKEVECAVLRNEISRCIAIFLQLIEGYLRNTNEGYDVLIKKEVSRASPFAKLWE